MANDTISYEEAFGLTSTPAAPGTSTISYEEAFGLPPAPPKRRTLAGIANDTVIEAANAAAGGVSAAANFVRPGNAVSSWIDKNIVEAGEASQSDAVKAEKQRFRQDVAGADGVMGELGAVGRYVFNNPGLAAAQAVGSFAGPGAAVKGGRTLASIAGLNAARGGLAGGAAAGAAMAGGDAAGTAYELASKAGATDEQAVAAGRQASVLPAVIGGVGGVVGAERLVAGAKGFAGNAASRALKTAAVEGAQEGIEEGVTQYEGQRAAMPYDKTIDPTKGVAAAAGMGAVLGGATGGGVSLLTGGLAAEGAPVQQSEQVPALTQQAQSAIEPVAQPAIDPNAGPLSKAASLAGDLGLAPVPAAPTAEEQRAQMEQAISRLPEDAQREARLELADADNESLPAGVRALRSARVQELANAAPAASVELTPEDMERGRVLQNFDARAPELPPVADYAPLIDEMVLPERRAEFQSLLATASDTARPRAERDAAAEVLHATFSPDLLQQARPTPDERLELQGTERARFGNEIDFEQASSSTSAPDAMAERINQLALDSDLKPGQALQLNQAHALRRRAAEQGITMSVIPHASGRGYDVAPTARLDPAARAAMPQDEAAAQLPYDQSPSGRMLAGQDGGARAETRPEAVARMNAATAQRQQVEAERQRRTELGLSNITPVTPVRERGASSAPHLTFDNAPTGRMVAGADGVRQEGRAEVVSRANAPAPTSQTVTSASGAPFATRQAAQQELQRQQLGSSHDVAPAGGDESLGFVLRPRAGDQRAPNWRTNAMQANRIARGLGIETKGKRLAQVVTEIDAADVRSRMGNQGVATSAPSTTVSAPELVAAGADRTSAGGVSTIAGGGGQQQDAAPRSGPRQELQPNQVPTQEQQAQAAIETGADSTPSGPGAARAAAPRSTTRIEDFGEELKGARKMLYAEAYGDSMAKAKELDVRAHPLSKTWPEPDYGKLLEGGTPAESVAMARALRDAVPTKPQSAWKLKGWTSRVETLRAFAEDLVDGKMDAATVADAMKRANLSGVANQAALYEAVGHERSLKGIELDEHSYSLYEGQRYAPPRPIWTVSRAAKGTAFGNWPRELAKGDSREQAIAAFKRRAAELLAEERAPTKGATFEIYGKRAGGAREFYIGKKIGTKVAELKAGFQDIKAARQYLADNQTELEDLLAKYKAVPPVRNAQNAPRIGEDYRKGADVTPEQFQEAFGFRGVQFGNYVEGARRQQDLNRAYDALMDLAGVLGVPARALSLGGRLGLAFGARGSGGADAAAAHYERGNVVINLTKREGAGSLAHEWWHGLDNYFSRQRGDGGAYMTVDAQSGEGVREEMRAAFQEVNRAINQTRMQERSRKLDDRKTKDYWTTKPEMSARAFESYVIAKLQDQNAGNDYLANVLPASVFALEGGYPYPTAGELPVIRGAFDNFFQTVQTREDDNGGTVLYSTSDQPSPERGLSVEQAQQAVQQALAGMSNPPPISVVSRSEELGVGAPDGVMGAAIPGEGRIVIVASAHGSADAVIETVFHETFHLGVRNVLPAADYVQAMLDLAKRDGRVQEYANRWKREASDAAQQMQALRDAGHSGSELSARFEALAIEEGLAVVAEELRAQKQAGTRLGMRVRGLANWLASVADRMGMTGLASRIRKMTYNEAERFVLRAIEHSGTTAAAPAAADITRFRSAGDGSVASRMGEAIKAVTVSDLKKQAGFKATDYRGLALQTLGRRQLVDIYGGMLPEMRRYSDLMARMDADKNEAGSGADQLAQDWAKLPDERALAELMHDSTLAQIDPSRDFVEGDNKTDWTRLQARYNALTPGAKDVYARARDTYRQHMRDVRSAIKERIERTEISSERKAAMLKRMDDEFFGHIKGVYFPLARFGQYVVVVKDAEGKVANVSRAETMAEADASRGQLQRAFPASKGYTVGKVLKAKDFVAERDSVGRGFMEQLYGVLDKQGMDSKQRAELEDALGQLYLSSLPDLSWAKHGIHRKGTPGFSQDARRAFAQNVFHGASYLAKLRYGDRLQDELGEMQRRVDAGSDDPTFDSVKAQQVVDEMVKRHEAAMNPKTNALSTALTSLGFIFHLGLSPASAMVNLTQTALVAYPVMGAKWGFKKASAALLKASGEAARGKNDITGSLSPEEKAAFDEAVRAGVVDVTMAHDLAGIAQGEDQNVSYKLRPVMRAASWMFHHAEKFNRQVTFVAAYRLARQAGAGDKAAYEQAVQATYDGHFDYSANNRPRVMQGNVARVVLLFKQYGQNMVYTLLRNAYQSLKGATPEQRSQARKALGGLLTTHAMAAGVLGLPMVTTLLAAASMLGGDDDEPWDAQVALQNMLADTFGQKPAEVLAHGLSRLTPWDISGRVGLDKLIFPDVQEGLEGQRLGEAAMSAALGPVAGIGINTLKGMQLMGEGHYLRGLESMAPTVLRGPLKSWRYGTDGVRDKSGIVVQDEVDAASLIGQASGFSPSSVRNAYEGKSAIVQHDRALQARRSALVEQFAMAAMAGDEEGKAEAREAIARFNEKNPNRRIQAMQLAQSVNMRQKRIREAEEGVYLPSKRRDALEAGRFAAGD